MVQVKNSEIEAKKNLNPEEFKKSMLRITEISSIERKTSVEVHRRKQGSSRMTLAPVLSAKLDDPLLCRVPEKVSRPHR